MKKISLIITGLAIIFLSACEEDTTAGLSKVTNYPLINVAGANPVFLAKGDTYTEPGVTATEGGAEIDVVTTANGAYRGGTELDTDVSDCYNVTYTATNVDGFDGTANRTVYVVETGDLVSSIEGLYTCDLERTHPVNATRNQNGNSFILIYKNDDGTYGMSCGIGGYYEIGVGYGVGFHAPCTITANDIAANDFTIEDFTSAYGGWPWPYTMNSFTVDAANKKINFVSEWAIGYTFTCELTQVQL